LIEFGIRIYYVNLENYELKDWSFGGKLSFFAYLKSLCWWFRVFRWNCFCRWSVLGPILTILRVTLNVLHHCLLMTTLYPSHRWTYRFWNQH